MDVAFAPPTSRLIANALGPAPDFMVEQAHAQDVPVAGLVGNRQHAERQKAAGVDIIVAQGYEAGGHTGEIATMVLMPEVVDAVAPTPVLAAGGIATGPPDRGGDGARRPRRVVRLGVAHHRGGRDPSRW